MNRRKKLEGRFKKRLKRARAKLDTRPQAKQYISKADRAKLEAQLAAEKPSNEPVTEQAETVTVVINSSE